MAYKDGPFIQAACFCEMVLTEGDGVGSLIRVVDTITHTERGPNPPDEMPPIVFPLKLVLMLKSGRAKGRSTIKVVPRNPNESTEDPLIFTVHFEGEEKGVNAVLDLNFQFRFEGTYWFDVYIEDHRLTSMPLRLKYDRAVVSSPPSP